MIFRTEPKKTDKIVYVAGAFDLFHIGHLDFLEKAKEHGTYLIVGLHTDPIVNRSISVRKSFKWLNKQVPTLNPSYTGGPGWGRGAEIFSTTNKKTNIN